MTAKLKIPTLLVVALFSVSCVDGYGVGDYDEDEDSEDDDDDDSKDKGSASTPDSGGKDAGASASWDAGKDSGSAWDAGKSADSGAGWSADAGKSVDAGWVDAGKDAGRGDASASASCSELTYDAFGEEFLTNYCVSCHGPTVQKNNIRLDSLANVVQRKAGVKSAVLSGNMPQGTKKPTEEERTQFGQWIDCGPN